MGYYKQDRFTNGAVLYYRMDINEFKTRYFLFDPAPYGRIFSFVDFGNVRPWAKELWPEENQDRINIEIDIEKLADLCNWVNSVKKFFYYGYFPSSSDRHESSIFRIDKAKRCGFEVKTKEVKAIPQYSEEGKLVGRLSKCNFDVEITMTLLTKIDKYDSVMLFSGDSDFGSLMSYLKNNGKQIIVICTRNRMSSELEKVANTFISAETLQSFLKYSKNTLRPFEAEE